MCGRNIPGKWHARAFQKKMAPIKLKMIKHEKVKRSPRYEFAAMCLTSMCRWWIKANPECPICKCEVRKMAFAYSGTEMINSHAKPECMRHVIRESTGLWGIAQDQIDEFTIQYRISNKKTSDPEEAIKACLAPQCEDIDDPISDDDKIVEGIFVNIILTTAVDAIKKKFPELWCHQCCAAMDRVCFYQTVRLTVEPVHLNPKCVTAVLFTMRTFAFAYTPTSSKSAVVFLDDGPVYSCGSRILDIVAELQKKLAGTTEE